jgi:hypothetical protein
MLSARWVTSSPPDVHPDAGTATRGADGPRDSDGEEAGARLRHGGGRVGSRPPSLDDREWSTVLSSASVVRHCARGTGGGTAAAAGGGGRERSRRPPSRPAALSVRPRLWISRTLLKSLLNLRTVLKSLLNEVLFAFTR